MNAKAPKKNPSGKTFVLVGASAITILLSLAYFGFRSLGRHRFENGSFMTEAHLNVAMLARGVAECAETKGEAGLARGLPETTPAVPSAIATLRTPFVSRAEDWQNDGFSCAKFAIHEPQRFRYRWERLGPQKGRAEADADFDGDGVPEVFLHVTVTCAGDRAALRCEIGSVEPTPWSDDAGS